MNGWDIIGDVHGHARDLERLLRQMGYRKRAGSWRCSGRKLLFLGDYVNRGPEISEAVDLVRSLVESEVAVALLGNHDFNLVQVVCGRLSGEEGATESKLVKQASDSLVALGASSARLEAVVAWLMTLPVVWEDEGFRAVHACWDEKAVACLLRTGGVILQEADFVPGNKGARARSVTILLNGPELKLPRVAALSRRNSRVRTKWWLPSARSWREAAYPEEPDLPGSPLPLRARKAFRPYGPEQPPLFFGHYGFPKPAKPVLPNAACLDFAVARDGALGGYRWDGERRLKAAKFVRLRD